MVSYHREQKLKRRYRLTEKGFQRILYLQGGGCDLCGSEKNLVVDHIDGKDGEPIVRGILCRGCNLALGHVKDDEGLLRRMIGYVRTNGGT